MGLEGVEQVMNLLVRLNPDSENFILLVISLLYLISGSNLFDIPKM